jgi:hypothetical protein
MTDSGTAEMYTADELKMADNGRQNQLFKCKDITIGNMENKYLEGSSSSSGWNSSRDRLNVWCALSCHELIGPFYFQEKTVNSTNYLDMLELLVVHQMAHLQPNIFLQDGAPPHWGFTVRESLNKTFLNCWIGWDGPVPWLPRSPV